MPVMVKKINHFKDVLCIFRHYLAKQGHFRVLPSVSQLMQGDDKRNFCALAIH